MTLTSHHGHGATGYALDLMDSESSVEQMRTRLDDVQSTYTEATQVQSAIKTSGKG